MSHPLALLQSLLCCYRHGKQFMTQHAPALLSAVSSMSNTTRCWGPTSCLAARSEKYAMAESATASNTATQQHRGVGQCSCTEGPLSCQLQLLTAATDSQRGRQTLTDPAFKTCPVICTSSPQNQILAVSRTTCIQSNQSRRNTNLTGPPCSSILSGR